MQTDLSKNLASEKSLEPTNDSQEISYYETRLRETLSEIQMVDAFLDSFAPEYLEATAYRARLLESVQVAMSQLGGAKKFVGDGVYAEYAVTGRTNAKVLDPDKCRLELEAIGGILPADLDAALPVTVPEPTVEARLTPLRAIEKYGAKYAAIVKRYIKEGGPKETLVVRSIEKNVTLRP